MPAGRFVFICAGVLTISLTLPLLAHAQPATAQISSTNQAPPATDAPPPERDRQPADKTLPTASAAAPAKEEMPVEDITSDDETARTLRGGVEEAALAGSTADPALQSLDPKLDCMSFAARTGVFGLRTEARQHAGEIVDGTYVQTDGNGYPWVRTVYPGQPAEQAGVEAGDKVLEVNGRPTYKLDITSLLVLYHYYDDASFTELLGLKKKNGRLVRVRVRIKDVDDPSVSPELRAVRKATIKQYGY